MTMLMGSLCQLTAVWLLYRRPYDLARKGEELFDRLELGFQARPDPVRFPGMQGTAKHVRLQPITTALYPGGTGPGSPPTGRTAATAHRSTAGTRSGSIRSHDSDGRPARYSCNPPR